MCPAFSIRGGPKAGLKRVAEIMAIWQFVAYMYSLMATQSCKLSYVSLCNLQLCWASIYEWTCNDLQINFELHQKECKSWQGTQYIGQMESQINASWKLEITCDSVWPRHMDIIYHRDPPPVLCWLDHVPSIEVAVSKHESSANFSSSDD